MRIVVTGATGFVGRALVGRLVSQGHAVVAVTRRPEIAQPQFGAGIECMGLPNDALGWVPVLTGTDAVVNLAGESMAGPRWTPERKATLVASRVRLTRDLVKGMSATRESARPRVLVSASGVSIYGDTGDRWIDETSPLGQGFSAELAREWEQAATPARELGVRVAIFRIGVVLGRGGGALAKLLPLFKRGLGGPLGSGSQYFSWVHLEDAVRALAAAVDDPRYSGVLNLTAPTPVTTRELARALGHALHRPAMLPAPGFALRLALGEQASMVLEGQRVAPKALRALGFGHRFVTVDQALQDLVNP